VTAPRVAAFPPPTTGNPYQRLLHAELERRGVRFVDAPALKARWVRNGAGELDAVHLHWLEFLYSADGRLPLRAALAHKRALGLIRALRALRARETRVVWTVHNLRPHESDFPWLADATIAAAIRASDALIVHSEHARSRLFETWRPAAPIAVLPHPNYIGAYPAAPRSREQERSRLGVPPDAFVYLVFGQIRPYKRVPEVVAAFQRLDAADARLVIAGAVAEPGLREQIEQARAGDPRVVLRFEAVPDADVAALHGAADAAVLHYRDVFSSGALMLALSFGLPVVGPADSTLTEVADADAVAAYRPGGLTAALAEIRVGDPERRRRAALDTAHSHDWARFASRVAALYAGSFEPAGGLAA
jgi:beta-1,4-mannosyltransferase